DLMLAAQNSHLLCYDNLSHLGTDLSDQFCRLATGAGLSTRELYTDDGEIIFEGARPVILTGIESLVVRGDLADRSVVLTLPRLERTLSDIEFHRAFEDARP